MEDKNKITTGKDLLPENKLLQDYLNGRLTAEEQHAFEQQLDEEDPFVQDAIEGFKNNQAEIDFSVYEINKNILKKLKGRKKRGVRKLSTNPVSFLAMILILALLIIAFVIIRMYLKG
jgi:anti-sigma-K factor RskA